MPRPTKKHGGDTMEVVEFRDGDYRKPAPIWPRWRDTALVESIAADLRDGVSEVGTSLRHGMSRGTVSMWLSRWAKAVGTSIEEDGPPDESEFSAAVGPIARALGEWIAESERLAQEGHAGRMWALPRRVQDVWGNAQTLTIDSSAIADPEMVATLKAIRGAG